MGRKIIIILLVAAALFFGGRYAGWWSAPWDKRASAAETRLFGNVEVREVELGFRNGGRIAALLVDEGDLVQAGDVLAQLDTRPMRDRIASADARIAAASAGAVRTERGNRIQEVNAANAAVAEARASLDEATRQHRRREALLARGFLSRAEFETSEAAMNAARARLTSAEAQASLVREGSRPEDKAISEAERQAAIADREAMITDMQDTELVAPSSGTVLTRAQEPGAIVQSGETVLTLSITQPVRVRAYVGEGDLPRVKPGMAVTVMADGTSQRWRGRIGYISPSAEFTPKNVETESQRSDLVYRLRITVDDPRGQLRQGQPVTVLLPSAVARADGTR